MQRKNTDLSGDPFYNNSGHRCDCAPLRVIKRALWMIQAGQGPDLFLGQSRLIGGLKEGHGKTEEGKNKDENIHRKRQTDIFRKKLCF